MMYGIWFLLLAVVIYGIVKAASGNRYSHLSEEEFESEAKRGSHLGAAVGGLQKIIDPGHRVEHVQEQRERLEADGAPSGGGPGAGSEIS